MFKSTSASMQSRERRKATDTVLNEHGVDPSAYHVLEDDSYWLVRRRAIGALKTDLQQRLSKINAQLARAAAQRALSGARVPPKVYAQWVKEQADLKLEMQQAERELAEVKLKAAHLSKKLHQEQRPSYEAAFIKMAKLLLAGPVYDRICTAAVHTMAGEDEKREEAA